MAVVIAMMTLGSSFQSYYVGQYDQEFAANAFSIGPQGAQAQAAASGTVMYFFPLPVFSGADVPGVEALPGVVAVAPYLQVGVAGEVRVGGEAVRTPFSVGVVEGGGALFSEGFLRVAVGAPPSGPSEAVVGRDLATSMSIELGGTNDTAYVLGRQVTLQVAGAVQKDTIVGVLGDSPASPGANTGVYLQLPQQGGNASTYSGMLVFASPSASMAKVQASVLGYLNSGSDALATLRSTGQGVGFGAVSTPGARAFLQEQVDEYSVIIVAMGVVALIGGAVGMSNTMLVSVAERRQEIGVIKAVGGSKGDLVRMFLVEAAAISAAGVALGLVAGAALGYWLTTFRVLGLALPLVYDVPWFFLAGGMGVVSGLLAGVYPAWKAANVPPAQVLRAG